MFFRAADYRESFFHGQFLALLFSVDFIFPIIFTITWINIIEVLIMLKNKVSYSEIIHFFRSSLFVLMLFYFGGLALAIATQFIFYIANPVRVAANSIMFTKWDYAIFGTYPWLSMHSFITAHWAEIFIYGSYLLTLFIIVILLITLIFKNVFLLRKFLLSYFIATVIAIPFWIIFPALAPDMMYRINILHVSAPSEIKEKLDNAHFSPTSQSVFLSLEERWVDKSGRTLPVTTFPSMHAAWGIIIVVIGIELWAPLAVVLVPWLLAELAGTIFTLEHYAVDVIFGIALGFLALYLASCLLKWDKKNSFDKWDLFASVSKK